LNDYFLNSAIAFVWIQVRVSDSVTRVSGDESYDSFNRRSWLIDKKSFSLRTLPHHALQPTWYSTYCFY